MGKKKVSPKEASKMSDSDLHYGILHADVLIAKYHEQLAIQQTNRSLFQATIDYRIYCINHDIKIKK